MTVPPLRPLAACLAAVVLLAACTSEGFPDSGSQTSAATSSTSTAPRPPAPLTGLPAPDGEDLNRPALAFKVDNAAAASQAGLDEADVVYEEVVEGGLTRLMAVYHSRGADPVGPIRSVRPTDVELVEPLGNSILVYSGGQPKVLETVRRAGLDTRSDDGGGDEFVRDPSREAPHDLMSSTAAFWRPGVDPTPPRPVAGYAADAPAGGTPATRVSVRFSGDATADWVYDGGRGRWQVAGRKGGPAVTASGAPVSAATLVFLSVRGRDTGLVDVNGDAVPGWLTTGSGELLVVRGGLAYTGLWTRPNPAASFTLRSGSGAEITLAPGTSWWSLVPVDGAVDVG